MKQTLCGAVLVGAALLVGSCSVDDGDADGDMPYDTVSAAGLDALQGQFSGVWSLERVSDYQGSGEKTGSPEQTELSSSVPVSLSVSQNRLEVSAMPCDYLNTLLPELSSMKVVRAEPCTMLLAPSAASSSSFVFSLSLSDYVYRYTVADARGQEHEVVVAFWKSHPLYPQAIVTMQFGIISLLLNVESIGFKGEERVAISGQATIILHATRKG